MYISDAVITANCFINIISIQRRGGGYFSPLGLPKCSGGGVIPLQPSSLPKLLHTSFADVYALLISLLTCRQKFLKSGF